MGIMAVRDFIAKLDDLDIHQGLFVTNTDFTSDSLGWAKNGTTKPIETWDGQMLQDKLMEITLGRTRNKIFTIENSLPLRGGYDDYIVLPLQNSDKIHVKRALLTFHPFYVISFNLHDRVKMPDRQIRTVTNSGEYYVDGRSGQILASCHERGAFYFVKTVDQKEIVDELNQIKPTTIEMPENPNHSITKYTISTTSKEAEFAVKNRIADDNKADFEYERKVGKNEYKKCIMPYKPSIKTITTQSKTVYVPRWDIQFESKKYVYNKIVFPASDITAKNEIAECRHRLRKKPTFAVCDICGIAKCESDITYDDCGNYYCKDHTPEGLKPKGESIGSKLRKFKIRK